MRWGGHWYWYFRVGFPGETVTLDGRLEGRAGGQGGSGQERLSQALGTDVQERAVGEAAGCGAKEVGVAWM